MQWGWELSQQWSSGEFRQIRVCNQKGQKGSTGRLSYPITVVFPVYTLQLPSICVLPTAFKTFCSNKLGILTGTSWHFSDISSDISARWAHESTSLDVNKANGMLTSNAKRIFCDNVTCFGTNKFCSNRSHLQELCKSASSAPHFLLARIQLSTCYPIGLSRIHLTASLYLCPADCFQDILFEQGWEFSLEQVGISPTYQVTYLLGGRMKVPHLMSIRPMECWLATLNASSATMSHALQEVKKFLE